jgi:hypothetical protein
MNETEQPKTDRTHPTIVFPSAAKRPTFVCYDEAFFVGNKLYKAGVYYHYYETRRKTDEDGDVVEVLVDRWICSVLKAICIVRANAGNEHSYLIEYVAHGERAPRRALLSQALLLGRPEESLKALRDLGVSVLHTNTKAVRAYLDLEHMRFSEERPSDFWRSERTVGWAPAPTCFVLPGETLGIIPVYGSAASVMAPSIQKAVALMTGRATSQRYAKRIPSRVSRSVAPSPDRCWSYSTFRVSGSTFTVIRPTVRARHSRSPSRSGDHRLFSCHGGALSTGLKFRLQCARRRYSCSMNPI